MTNIVRGLLAATALAGAFVAAPAFAQEEPAGEFSVTGNVALVTDYRFRGVSQSNGDPAIQGGITLNHASGFYVGAWSSSIDLSPVGTNAIYGNQELDLFGGWTGELTPGLTVDAGLLYYAYPGGHVGKAEFFEPYASLSTTYGPAKVKVGVNYAWSQDALFDDDNLYVYSNIDIAVPNTPFTVSGHLGYTDGPLAPPFATGLSGDRTALDYSVGASVTVLGKVTLGVQYVGVEGPVLNRYTDDQVVGTLSVSF